jgi:hypothetical protein
MTMPAFAVVISGTLTVNSPAFTTVSPFTGLNLIVNTGVFNAAPGFTATFTNNASFLGGNGVVGNLGTLAVGCALNISWSDGDIGRGHCSSQSV